MANTTSHIVFEFSCFVELGGLRPLLFLPFSLFYFLSLGANFLLVLVVARQRTLHSPMYLLIAGMACVDGALPLLVMSPFLVGFLSGWNQVSLSSCLLQMFVVHLLGAFQSTILLWMALDRCLAVMCPLRYSTSLSVKVLMVVGAPLVLRNVSLISVLVLLLSQRTFCGSVVLNCFCEHMAVVKLVCGDSALHSVVGLLTIGLIPVLDFILISASYVVVMVTALSGRSVAKAANTMVTHVIVMSVSLTVLLVVFISHRVDNHLPRAARLLGSTLYLFVPSTTNSLTFGLRTKEIRRHLQHLLTLHKHSAVH
ncbi:unnamed protein product [Knipowitschia caucasica]|uniref:G-protein coupled receptors family 1 profile domain-containing protein n=1 Tax=Knipowitschia caucasica TaxID=637954 RepID=A0AAV2J5H2_KNICA